MNRIQQDPFWDGQTGGGVRCSTQGREADQYQDPATQFFEGNGGRSIASLLPGGVRGLRGVVIPRATVFGGSRGFDPHKPRLMNIDPDIKGQSCVVDLSQITKESMEAAFLDAAQNPVAQQDIRLLASQTFHNLAVGYEPVGMGPSRTPLIDRRPPLGAFSGYVVPRAALGGGQMADEPAQEPLPPEENISPSVSPRTGPTINPAIFQNMAQNKFRTREDPRNMQSNTGLPPPPVFQTDENGVPITGGLGSDEVALDGYQIQQPQQAPMRQKPGFVDQSPQQPRQAKAPPRAVKIAGAPVQAPQVQRTSQSVGAPETKITFEMQGMGEIEAYYHEVIKNGCVLVLVYDTRFKGGMRYMPPALEQLIALRVDEQKCVYFVNSTGTKFTHDGREYCILVIDQEQELEAV